MFRTSPNVAAVALALAAAFAALPARAADKAGCTDHPQVSRFAGSELADCLSLAFEEAAFPPATLESNAAANKARAIKASGKVEVRTYRVPAGKTATEVAANYRAALVAAGFSILSEHADRVGAVWNAMSGPALRGAPQPDRYLLARKGPLTVSVGVGIFQNDRSRIGVDLRIVEAKPLETGQVTVDAAAIQGALAEDGKIALYGILFDTGKAELKPESAPQLVEIAKLLAARPSLNVYVVGHTDNQGALALNQDLSKRRAEAVVAALVKDHAIAPARLAAAGVGPLAPVASNATEAGRARNRRTEIVAR